MHLFRLLFHIPFCHESLLKCLFDWNRPCCSHTLLLTALHPAITSHSLSLFLCSRAGALFGIPPPLLSYHLPAFFFSPSTSNEGSPPPSPHTPPLSACVCLFHVGSRQEKVEVFCTRRCSSFFLSLPALILDNKKRARYSQFNYWLFSMQRCMWVCVHGKVGGGVFFFLCVPVCVCRHKEEICTSDLYICTFLSKVCIFRCVFVMLSIFSADTSALRRPSSLL